MAQGKVALVTGGGTGIGQAAALALQGDGWNVAIAGRRRAELDKTMAMGKTGGGKMVAIPADVGKSEDVKRLFAEVQKAFGGRLDRGAPCYGEDNHYVYGELLGMSAQEIEALAEEGVI